MANMANVVDNIMRGHYGTSQMEQAFRQQAQLQMQLALPARTAAAATVTNVTNYVANVDSMYYNYETETWKPQPEAVKKAESSLEWLDRRVNEVRCRL